MRRKLHARGYSAHRSWKRVSYPRKLELQAIVIYLT